MLRFSQCYGPVCRFANPAALSGASGWLFLNSPGDIEHVCGTNAKNYSERCASWAERLGLPAPAAALRRGGELSCRGLVYRGSGSNGCMRRRRAPSAALLPLTPTLPSFLHSLARHLRFCDRRQGAAWLFGRLQPPPPQAVRPALPLC